MCLDPSWGDPGGFLGRIRGTPTCAKNVYFRHANGESWEVPGFAFIGTLCLLKYFWLSFRPCYFKQQSAPAATSVYRAIESAEQVP